jgi:hypothetical protein
MGTIGIYSVRLGVEDVKFLVCSQGVLKGREIGIGYGPCVGPGAKPEELTFIIK